MIDLLALNGIEEADPTSAGPLDIPRLIAGIARTAVSASPSLRLLTPYDTNCASVADAGWAIIVPADEKDILAHVKELVDFRRAADKNRRFRIFQHTKDQDARTWMKAHGVTPGIYNFDAVPYYLMLVGSPKSIPFDFQCDLQTDYAVGRIWFPDHQGYTSYCGHVVASEISAPSHTRPELTFWCPKNRRIVEGVATPDEWTSRCLDTLVLPLARGECSQGGDYRQSMIPDSEVSHKTLLLEDDATREALLGQFNNPRASPRVVVAAAHGVAIKKEGPLQERMQGALISQTWQGAKGSVSHAVASVDIDLEIGCRNLIAILAACYSAGCPEFDTASIDSATRICASPFVSLLPARLLQAGALAVVGHVDRIWTCSFDSRVSRPMISHYRDLIGMTLAGQPVGHAFRSVQARASALANYLVAHMRGATTMADSAIASGWLDWSDARNHILLGDPGARLRIERGT